MDRSVARHTCILPEVYFWPGSRYKMRLFQMQFKMGEKCAAAREIYVAELKSFYLFLFMHVTICFIYVAIRIYLLAVFSFFFHRCTIYVDAKDIRSKFPHSLMSLTLTHWQHSSHLFWPCWPSIYICKPCPMLHFWRT